MIPQDALQIIVVVHQDDLCRGDYPRFENYLSTLRMAISGTNDNAAERDFYLSDGVDTGASLKRFVVSSKQGVLPPDAKQLDSATHSLIVVFIGQSFVEDTDCVFAIGNLFESIFASEGAHSAVVFGVNETVLSNLRKTGVNEAIGRAQGQSLETLGEYTLRPIYAAMMVLTRCHRLLVHGRQGTNARFFISHAKIDGLPLAQALKGLVEAFAWLDSFYDARDILPGDDFEEALEDGIKDSMLIALRSDEYDQRLWCRREVRWAEYYDRPILVVDTKIRLSGKPTILGFIGVPTVRIPDGNLVRVLLEALREWVRIGVLKERFRSKTMTKHGLPTKSESISRPPSITSLKGAMNRLKARGAPDDSFIVHPEPALDTDSLEAFTTIFTKEYQHGRLLPFKTYLATIQ